MKVCSHKGYLVAVFTRDEHCPPHVHVGTSAWDARFLFSFWHNGIRLWDVTPAKNGPCTRILEELRQVIKRRANLRRARECWWASQQTLCLDNQAWDLEIGEVVAPRYGRLSASPILCALFDARSYKTQLHLAGYCTPLEIEL
ncbi:DUF4160 domain-containing protein [Pseudomonas putida]|uniref:DUF4160 domain-containing protein n=1 Tax=Pseudomonas putida TaxID=303 RepID=UPI002363B642|nr:DUF4160 domain-containing protein [Pseudomonas putida]MDD1966646.1 DUF4160 domain-containing protein [Pseudomonas putida]